jgi:ABC-2 type transport system permease protein
MKLRSLPKNLLKINPIIVKEMRSRMRGPRAFITLTAMLLFMGGVMYAMLQIILAQSRYMNVLSPQVGQSMFAALAFLMLFMISAVTPAVTAGAISGEKEKQTYEMLMATPLSGTQHFMG